MYAELLLTRKIHADDDRTDRQYTHLGSDLPKIWRLGDHKSRWTVNVAVYKSDKFLEAIRGIVVNPGNDGACPWAGSATENRMPAQI